MGSVKVNRHNASVTASSEDALCWCQQASRGAGMGTLANGWGTFKKTAFAVKDASGQQCGKANKKCSECYYRGGPCCESTENGEKSSTCAQEIQRKEYGNEQCTCAGLRVFKKTIDELNDARVCVKGTPCKECY